MRSARLSAFAEATADRRSLGGGWSAERPGEPPPAAFAPSALPPSLKLRRTAVALAEAGRRASPELACFPGEPTRERLALPPAYDVLTCLRTITFHRRNYYSLYDLGGRSPRRARMTSSSLRRSMSSSNTRNLACWRTSST